jgi:hypothetical protein
MGEMGRGTSAFLVVQIPADSLTRFCELCKPIAFRLPPRVDLDPRSNLAPTSNQPPAEAELRDRDGKPLQVGDRVTFISYWGGLPSPPRTGTVRAIEKTEADMGRYMVMLDDIKLEEAALAEGDSFVINAPYSHLVNEAVRDDIAERRAAVEWKFKRAAIAVWMYRTEANRRGLL